MKILFNYDPHQMWTYAKQEFEFLYFADEKDFSFWMSPIEGTENYVANFRIKLKEDVVLSTIREKIEDYTGFNASVVNVENVKSVVVSLACRIDPDDQNGSRF